MADHVNPIDLARLSVLHYLKHKKRLPCPTHLPEFLKQSSACFVTLYQQKKLRGCVGTLEPQENTLAGEIIRNAVRSAFNDPRFEPVTLNEMKDVSFSIDVVCPSEKSMTSSNSILTATV